MTPSGGNTFYSGAGCASGGLATILSGQNTAALYFNDTAAGSPQLTIANSGGLAAPGTQTEVVNAGVATKLVYVSGPYTLLAGTCSAAINIQAQDVFNNPANVGANKILTPTMTPAGGNTFYSGAGCASGGLATILSGQNTAALYFNDTTAGNPQLTIANTRGLAAPGNQKEVVNAGVATKLVYLSGPYTGTAGTCSAAINIQAQDVFNNPANVGANNILTPTMTPAGGNTFYSGAGCASGGLATILSGQNTAALYFNDV